jgi:formamidopyrimidine-DNA glycosylase
MPELPEVETMCRGVAAAAGRRIVAVSRPRSRLRPIQFTPSWAILRRRLVGQTIAAVGRLGKRVVLELADGARLVIEPRMTGLVLPADPPNTSHLRLHIELEGDRQILFWDQRGLGTVSLLDADRFQTLLARGGLGPDALTIALDMLRERLGHSRRPLKVALMDQAALAGVGNIYASEVLHRAGLHPGRPCCTLRPTDWARLHAALREVLEMAVRCEGSTLGDGTYRIGRERVGGFQQYHRVYQRSGQPCLTCGRGSIERIVQAQRSTFFCPKCQKQWIRRGR